MEEVPEHCPGTSSESAGHESACRGCPNQSICQSTPKNQTDPDLAEITRKLSLIKHKIIILSGKGGVGKSTFTTQLAFTLALTDPSIQVGILDLDICGPSIPRMTGTQGHRLHASQSGWTPVYPMDNLAIVSVSFMLEREDDAIIWRGPKKNALIKQFLKDVDWGAHLDYLLIDTPPGTSDEHISLAQYLMTGVDGAVLVTTPQEVSLQDVRKEIDFCEKVKMPIIGVVENMSLFVCPHCSKESRIFDSDNSNEQEEGVSGGRLLAKNAGIDFLGEIPLDPAITRCCERGISLIDADSCYKPATRTIEAYNEVIMHILSKV